MLCAFVSGERRTDQAGEHGEARGQLAQKGDRHLIAIADRGHRRERKPRRVRDRLEYGLLAIGTCPDAGRREMLRAVAALRMEDQAAHDEEVEEEEEAEHPEGGEGVRDASDEHAQLGGLLC